MNDIIRMAREAGLGDIGLRGGFVFFQPGSEGLERFAALVRADEREACADICDQHTSIEGIAQRCAAAIRTRGNA